MLAAQGEAELIIEPRPLPEQRRLLIETAVSGCRPATVGGSSLRERLNAEILREGMGS